MATLEEAAARLRDKAEAAILQQEAGTPTADAETVVATPAGTPETTPQVEEVADLPSGEVVQTEAAPGDPSAPPAAIEEVEAGADEDVITSFNELAEHLQVTPDYLYGLSVTTPGGEKVSIEQLKGIAQDADAIRSQTAKLDRDRATFDAEQRERTRLFTNEVATSTRLIERMAAQIQAEEDATGWSEMDAGEIALQRQNFRERKDGLASERDAVLGEVEKHNAALRAEQERSKNDTLRTEGEKIITLIPEWNNPQVRQQDNIAMTGYLRSQGYSDEQISNVVDSRAIAMARKAMLYDQGVTKQAVTRKRVLGLPKRVKSTTNTPTVQTDERVLGELRSKLKKSGSMKDAAALRKHINASKGT